MTSTDAPTRSTLALKGSTKIVSEFFEYSINTILYQRGIYQPEDFKVVKKYGLNMLVSTDDDVKRYIKRIMKQLHSWMGAGKINKLIVCIVSKETGDTMERWQFDVEIMHRQAQTQQSTDTNVPESVVEKDEKEITKEIQSLVRQITASVTFLPELTGRATFNVLVYTDNSGEVPKDWVDSDARDVRNAEAVQLRSFTTGAHKVGLQVSYTLDEQEV
ncbi:HORMA domain-containing protein [Taphrina deformans PYCC 5710]|uniref:HORMA domain-containing protein n=1 Tax=Taphrina deformans (strain PYCC 5710 / ATCC 11124 / CBS 356.35 / IMI 108563 / JCM 9778 / NBRC 8474) TaxID=1097556 RepID=R4XA94_TAPDE|nr:HORMA domain-containing protein [Taphrina deformans PYCC 5710]|eukprot:CCG82723.1 HORMA domain-containing protein [Taphrina deformans PYCC 5710]